MLGHDASGAGQKLFRAERAHGTTQEQLRSNEIAELRHGYPPQREAGASSRSATRFSAPSGSPAASARAAAAITEPIRIPPLLSLPRLRLPVLI
jgi:hypothetical protein